MNETTIKNIKKQLNSPVVVTMKDGYTYVGTLQDVDENGIVLYNSRYGTSIISFDNLKMLRIKSGNGVTNE